MNPVFRRTRRVLPFLLVGTLGLGLASCGDDDGSGGTDNTLESVQVEGEVGTAPEVTFDRQLSASEVTTEVVIEGDGEEIGSGDQALAHLWIGNGFVQEKAFTTYDQEKPELVTVDDEQLSPLFVEAIEGQTAGSRVVASAPASEAFGEQGNAQLGIGNKDTVVVVVDLLSSVLEGPEGDSAKAPSWAPEIVEEDDVPTGFDFSKAPDPSEQLRSAELVKGDGATVEKGQTIVVDYLGQEFGGKKPFDDSFSGEPTTFQIGVGQVVSGWDKTLVGAKVGSRIVMSVPPKEGYGEKGNPQIKVSGDDTLYFLVDILAAG
ncbi:MAG TPA: FKBP-type peptidyl-prolyl cis-trans isomerase [Nocardioides sp.]|nr:FKBP-type peptidyl-prolyl cis-trans isomerase [Nocardioides sp.]